MQKCVWECVCVYTSPVSTQIYKIPEGQEEIIMERYLKWLCGLGIDVDGMLWPLASPGRNTFGFTFFTDFFFWCELFLKVFTEKKKFSLNLWQYCFCFLCFGFLALRSVGSQLPNQGSTYTSCFGRWNLNHWIAQGNPWFCLLTCSVLPLYCYMQLMHLKGPEQKGPGIMFI